MEEVVDALENRLSRLTSPWSWARKNGDSVEESRLLREYHSVLRQLWDRGHGFWTVMSYLGGGGPWSDVASARSVRATTASSRRGQ